MTSRSQSTSSNHSSSEKEHHKPKKTYDVLQQGNYNSCQSMAILDGLYGIGKLPKTIPINNEESDIDERNYQNAKKTRSAITNRLAALKKKDSVLTANYTLPVLEARKELASRNKSIKSPVKEKLLNVEKGKEPSNFLNKRKELIDALDITSAKNIPARLKALNIKDDGDHSNKDDKKKYSNSVYGFSHELQPKISLPGNRPWTSGIQREDVADAYGMMTKIFPEKDMGLSRKRRNDPNEIIIPNLGTKTKNGFINNHSMREESVTKNPHKEGYYSVTLRDPASGKKSTVTVNGEGKIGRINTNGSFVSNPLENLTHIYERELVAPKRNKETAYYPKETALKLIEEAKKMDTTPTRADLEQPETAIRKSNRFKKEENKKGSSPYMRFFTNKQLNKMARNDDSDYLTDNYYELSDDSSYKKQINSPFAKSSPKKEDMAKDRDYMRGGTVKSQPSSKRSQCDDILSRHIARKRMPNSQSLQCSESQSKREQDAKLQKQAIGGVVKSATKNASTLSLKEMMQAMKEREGRKTPSVNKYARGGYVEATTRNGCSSSTRSNPRPASRRNKP